ncbi:MAG: serine hydrolase domain-containing protein, partial [Gemmatimonadaceae bacterium]
RGVTVRQLLNHTSGIKDYTSVPRWLRLMALPLPQDSMIALFRDEPADFAPGTEWRYDNSGYYLLGVIIERALQSGRVIKPASYQLMTTPIPLPGGKAQSYGFGLGVGTFSGHRMISHNGGINGFNAQMASYPDDSLIVAVLVNVESGEADKFERKVSRWALGIPDEVVRDLPVAEAESARMVGKYAQGDTHVEVRVDGGHLVLLGLGAPTKLLHQGSGQFKIESNPDMQVTFPGAGAKADQMVVVVPGGSLTLPRVP